MAGVQRAASEGYSLSRFTSCTPGGGGKLNVEMRQVRHAGKKVFFDFCDGPRIVLPSGQIQQKHLFVAVWRASNCTFVWSSGYCLPVIDVPVNLRSSVSKAWRYEPDVNPTT